jgi:hypothetical protein
MVHDPQTTFGLVVVQGGIGTASGPFIAMPLA